MVRKDRPILLIAGGGFPGASRFPIQLDWARLHSADAPSRAAASVARRKRGSAPARRAAPTTRPCRAIRGTSPGPTTSSAPVTSRNDRSTDRQPQRNHLRERLVRRAAAAHTAQHGSLSPRHCRRLLRRRIQLRRCSRRRHGRPLRLVRRGRPDVERNAGHRRVSRLQPDDDRPGDHTGSRGQRREHRVQGRVGVVCTNHARCASISTRIPAIVTSPCDDIRLADDAAFSTTYPITFSSDVQRYRRHLRNDHTRRVGRHQDRHDRRRGPATTPSRGTASGLPNGTYWVYVIGSRQRQWRRLGVLHRAGSHRAAGAADTQLLRAVEPCAAARHPRRHRRQHLRAQFARR